MADGDDPLLLVLPSDHVIADDTGFRAAVQAATAAAASGRLITSQITGGELGGLIRYRSEEHTSELQSLMRISYAVFCLKKKKIITNISETNESPQHNTQ